MERTHYSLGDVGRILSLRGSGRVCPGSNDSWSRCAFTGILVPQMVVPPSSNPPWRGQLHWLAPEVPLLEGCWWSPKHFWSRWACRATALRPDPHKNWYIFYCYCNIFVSTYFSCLRVFILTPKHHNNLARRIRWGQSRLKRSSSMITWRQSICEDNRTQKELSELHWQTKCFVRN